MKAPVWWVLARNEIRVCTRLSRTKFILWLTFAICVWYFVIVTLFQMQDSGVLPMYGVISPRYFLGILGSNLLALFCIGVLLFAFDMHSRDERYRVQEVLDCKPVGSLQFFLGRLYGVFLIMGLLLMLVLTLAIGYGLLSEAFAIPFGEPIEPWSVASFLLLDVLPNFIFFGGLVLLLARVIRPRFMAFLLVAFCMFSLQWITSRLPWALASPLQMVTGNVIFPSEIIPTLWNLEVVLNRIALILMGLGFLHWLALLHSRNTGSDFGPRKLGLYSFVGGILLIAGMLGAQLMEQQQIADWKRFHDEHFEPDSFPDIHDLRGNIDIYPGRTIEINLALDVSVAGEHSGEFVLFSLNPNYRIDELSISGETVNDAKFKKGLLRVPRRYFSEDIVELRLKAKGRPNSQFAYLDSVERMSEIVGPEARQLRYLGTENYIFHPEFVVLMPGIKWYPTSGTATNEDLWSRRRKDFFTVDVHVSVPSGWLVAGPAQRELAEEDVRAVFRFRSKNSLPQIALVASRFESVSHQVDGIEFELLFSRVHKRNFDALTLPDNPPHRPIVEHKLEQMSSSSLDYPYSVYSLVEVPAALRTFGGGRSLKPVLGMPGILMMPETSLPTMNLDSLHAENDYRRAGDLDWADRNWVSSKIHRLGTYFGIEQFAGNHLVHFYQSVFFDQVSATGPRAEMLNLILEQVIHLVFEEREISFEFDIGLDREVLDLSRIDPVQIANIFRSIEASPHQRYIEMDRGHQILEWFTARNRRLTSVAVMEAVESLSLADYEPSNESTAERRALRLRTLAISRLLMDLWGTDVIVPIIAELRQRFRGQNFSYDDFLSVTKAHGVDFEQQLGDMIYSSSLPGFITSNVAQRRGQTDEDGTTIFETTFELQNGESTAGFCRVIPGSPGMAYLRDFGNWIPVFVEKNQTLEVVLHSGSPRIDVVVQPYLSLNLDILQLDLPTIQDLSEEENRYGGTPEIVSIREVEPVQSIGDSFIVIDDLDSGFSVVDNSSRFQFNPFISLARRFVGVSDSEMIHGLPTYQFNEILVQNDTWERKSDTTAYGKYWKTLALNRRGNGESFAKFSTTLPSKGSWQVEYFLPRVNISRTRRYGGSTYSETIGGDIAGVAKIDVHIDEVVNTESLDAMKVGPGWHVVGAYEVDNPEVEVWISNPNEYDYVYADAIRWSPVENGE